MLAHVVVLEDPSRPPEELSEPLTIHEVARKFRRPGVNPIVYLGRDGVARVSFVREEVPQWAVS
jgi:hypothetical protein